MRSGSATGRDRRTFLAITIMTVALGIGWTHLAEARSSLRRHEMSGTVKRIEREAITIISDGESKPRAFAWNSKETSFFRNAAPAAVDLLHVGTRVTIRCSHPFFGSPFLYRLSWQERASTADPSSRNVHKESKR